MSKFVRMFNSNTNDLSRIMNSYKLPGDRQGVGFNNEKEKEGVVAPTWIVFVPTSNRIMLDSMSNSRIHNFFNDECVISVVSPIIFVLFVLSFMVEVRLY